MGLLRVAQVILSATLTMTEEKTPLNGRKRWIPSLTFSFLPEFEEEGHEDAYE